ncbi:MAG: hypothetical protein AB7Q37_02600 [Pyrinomonadaceae bacterium]
MIYYLGGYYLVLLRPTSFGASPGRLINTASECLSENLIGHWAYPWDKPARKDSAGAEAALNLEKSKVDAIREWVGAKTTANSIGWQSVFLDVQTAIEYRERFFPDLDGVSLLGLYFSENESAEILNEFKPESKGSGEIGIYQMLLKQLPEVEGSRQKLLGFDLVGIEYGGDFHSFHCHDMAGELSNRFGLVLNRFGLFNEVSDWQPVLDYMNDEETGCEPVPWFAVKVKLIDLKAERL